VHHPRPVLVLEIPAGDAASNVHRRVEIELLASVFRLVEVVGDRDEYLHTYTHTYARIHKV
jgi:hypothetical protein